MYVQSVTRNRGVEALILVSGILAAVPFFLLLADVVLSVLITIHLMPYPVQIALLDDARAIHMALVRRTDGIVLFVGLGLGLLSFITGLFVFMLRHDKMRGAIAWAGILLGMMGALGYFFSTIVNEP